MEERDPKEMKLGELVREISDITLRKTLDNVNPNSQITFRAGHMREYNPGREQLLYEELDRREGMYTQ
ncbi:MAG: hypothetical protein ABIH49_01900 [archaeon]